MTTKLTGRVKKQTVSTTKPNMPIIGKIKVGKKNDKGLPESLDYFIARGKYESYFKEAYPGKPNSIQVIFASDNILQSCNERWECRDRDGRLAGYGDGTNYYLFNGEEYEPVQDPEDSKKEILEAGKWSVILTIRFIIPKIPGVFGLWEFSTKGVESSVANIRDTFDSVLEKAGTVVNIPFDLTVEMAKSQKPGAKSRFPVVSLIPNLSVERLQVLHTYLQSGKTEINKLGVLTEEKLLQLGEGSK